MSYDFHSETHVKALRKKARCAHCEHLIPVGSPATRYASKWEGDFHSGAFHRDCHQLWLGLYDLADFGYDGAPYEFGDMFDSTDASGKETQEMLDHFRGHLPHAVTRVEFFYRGRLPKAPTE